MLIFQRDGWHRFFVINKTLWDHYSSINVIGIPQRSQLYEKVFSSKILMLTKRFFEQGRDESSEWAVAKDREKFLFGHFVETDPWSQNRILFVPDPSFWLVETSHVTRILDCDWSIGAGLWSAATHQSVNISSLRSFKTSRLLLHCPY